MTITKCRQCGGSYYWSWTEAFDKFGFGDGDGQNETWRVEDVLREAGYDVESHPWGIHNITISSIKRDGVEMMPDEHSEMRVGYDDPRGYLPVEVVKLLDNAFPEMEVLS